MTAPGSVTSGQGTGTGYYVDRDKTWLDQAMMGAIGSIGVFRIAKGWVNKDYGEIAWTFFPGPEMMWKGLTTPYDVGKSLYEGNYTAAVFRYTDHVLTGLSFAVGLPGEGTAMTQTIKEGVIVEGEVTSGILAGEIEASAAKVVEKEAAKGGETILEGAVKSNYNRFVSKIPANSKASASFELLEDGNYLFKATSPGKVPGSSALYQKWVNPQGETFKMLKTTFAPDGSIIHIKPKI